MHGNAHGGKDGLVEQLRRNGSSTRLIGGGASQAVIGGGKRMVIASERGRVNMLRESMGLGEQEKGLVIVDMRDIGAEQGLRAWKVA